MAFLPLSKFVDSNYSLIYGVDEAGRGPWAGPVVGCVLHFPKEYNLRGIDDSKKLTAEKREELFEKLIQKCHFGIGIAGNAEIDSLGLLKATNLAFTRALENLTEKGAPAPDFLLVDGRDRWKFPCPFKTIIRGDSRVKCIAAASIVAKVVRDRLMDDFAEMYPQYGFEAHKGYGTSMHQKAIRDYGLCAIHRKSFKPIADLFQTSLF